MSFCKNIFLKEIQIYFLKNILILYTQKIY